MKLRNSMKIALVAAALCGIDTGNVFAALPDISAVSAITQRDVKNVFDVIKRSIAIQLEKYEERGRPDAWLRLKGRDLRLEDMTEEARDKIRVPEELRGYIKLFSLQIDGDYKLYMVMHDKELVLSLFKPNMMWTGGESSLTYRLDFTGDYGGNAWLINTDIEPVSINLQPSAMNDYRAVQVIRIAGDDLLNDLQLDDKEKNCIKLSKRPVILLIVVEN